MEKAVFPHRRCWLTIPALCAGILTVLAALLAASAQATIGPVRIAGHIPQVVKFSQPVDWVDPNENVSLAFVLPFRNQAALDDLVRRQYDPSDPMYGQYLSNQQFVAQFGPSQGDYDAIAAFARSHNMTVTRTIPSRKLLEVNGAAKNVEAAFGLRLVQYKGPDGRIFRAPNDEPAVPADIAPRITGVSGLSTSATWHKNIGQLVKQVITIPALSSPFQIGSGPSGALTPHDVQTAYNLKQWPPSDPNDTTGYGKGQTLAVFELDVYSPADIVLYENEFGLPQLVPTNMVVTPPTPTGGADEVTLDIELQLAMAPLATALLVYEGANNSPQVVQQYQQIADDDLAKQISTSWGTTETNNDAPTRNGEYNAFQQMAAQGQSIFAASGDSGAYDGSNTLNGGNTTTLLVDDPASQPFMCGTGGTTLSVVTPGTDEHYRSERTWGDASAGQGGGGGISLIWPIPSYQVGAIHSNSLGSTTMRNVPDVALNADPNTGYDIVFGGTDMVLIFGGTSCCSPLWAGFTARVNEARANNGLAPLGFANPALYAAGKSTHSARDYHDIADGSTNLYYPAVKGYDDATGWGSFIGDNLITDLAAPLPTGLLAQPGNGYNLVTWKASTGATGYRLYRSVGAAAPSLIASTTKLTYTDKAVVNGTTYNYFLQAVYTGSASFQTDPSSATPGTVVITAGPFFATKTGGKATITWTTNVLADSKVIYTNNSTNQTLSVYHASKQLQQGLNLTGLSHGVSYSFYVTSFDGHVTATSATRQFTEP